MLSTRHNFGQKLTDSDIEILKGYFDGNQTGMSIYDIVVAVMRTELNQLALVRSVVHVV